MVAIFYPELSEKDDLMEICSDEIQLFLDIWSSNEFETATRKKRLWASRDSISCGFIQVYSVLSQLSLFPKENALVIAEKIAAQVIFGWEAIILTLLSGGV